MSFSGSATYHEASPNPEAIPSTNLTYDQGTRLTSNTNLQHQLASARGRNTNPSTNPGPNLQNPHGK